MLSLYLQTDGSSVKACIVTSDELCPVVGPAATMAGGDVSTLKYLLSHPLLDALSFTYTVTLWAPSVNGPILVVSHAHPLEQPIILLELSYEYHMLDGFASTTKTSSSGMDSFIVVFCGEFIVIVGFWVSNINEIVIEYSMVLVPLISSAHLT